MTTLDRLETRRLAPRDAALAARVFAVMAAVFEEPAPPSTSDHAARLLERPDFWVFAALDDGEPIGGLTAHVLPLARVARSELLIYDLAVLPARQRRGVGRRLMAAALADAWRLGLVAAWVPAADEDDHALDFYRAIGGEPGATTIFTFGPRT